MLFSILPSEVSQTERFSGDNVIFKPVGETIPDMVFLGSLPSFDLSYSWTQDKCVPLVREITFENGEVCVLLCIHTRIHMFRWRRVIMET